MTNKFERARTLSAQIRVMITVLGFVIVGVAIWYVVKATTDGPWLARMLYKEFGALAPFTVTPLQTSLIIVVNLAQICAILFAMVSLASAFAQISKTGGVDYKTALGVRRAGVWFGVAAVLLVVSIPLTSLIASIGQPVGMRFLSIGFGTQHLLALLLSLVLIVLGHVLALAADIAEDNRQII